MHTENTTLSIMHHAIERLELSERDVILMASTVGHQTGFLYGHCLNVLLGATTVWMDIWNPAEAARLIEAERVTVSMGATPFLRDLTYSDAGPSLRSLRLFIAAGAPIPRALVRDARGAARLRDLGRLGHDRERHGHLQRPPRPRGEDLRQRRRAAGRHGAAGRGRRRRAGRARRRGGPAGARAVAVRGLREAAAVHRGRAHRGRLVQDRRPGDPRSGGLPRHHRPVEGSDHPRRARTSRSWRSRTCSTLIRRSRAWPSWPSPTRASGSGPVRW